MLLAVDNLARINESYGFDVADEAIGAVAKRLRTKMRGGDEPIIKDFVLQLGPVISVIFVVPALTMRLLSEETRSGTLEDDPFEQVGVTLLFVALLGSLARTWFILLSNRPR